MKAENKSEKRYIAYRKMKAFSNKVCFYLCRIFPIKKNLISVCTFEGKGGFGCNPKYIVQELHRRNPEYRFVWFVNDMNKDFPDYIRKVPNTLWSRAYWLSRSKVWIDNYRKPYGTCKRRGQYYLNTNHYTLAIKCVGLWRGEGFSRMAYLVSKNDSDMIDDLVIDSKFCEEMCPKGLVYQGEFLKTGAPRCDILYGDRQEQKATFRKKHGIREDAKIVMFAPTFREGAKDGKRSVFSGEWTIDFKRLLGNLEKKFGGTWYLCIRVHPQLAPTFENYSDPEIRDRIINESQADDMYAILAAMDAYITDYSSACFEAGFAEIPVFLYADDIEKYTSDRGALFWDIDPNRLNDIPCNSEIFKELRTSLPYPVVTDNEDLEECIDKFDSEKYYDRLCRFHFDIELVFDGKASLKLAKKIEGIIGK
ncbi:MAG: CDP-glycerol glycerophosphotransferase family protein [Lachnospiraceae bacterium]|nr:CDP-glycerol glycerophosphotransferase family protein [Lachnospiraceae bacterium]